jgi:hypothetical protein
MAYKTKFNIFGISLAAVLFIFAGLFIALDFSRASGITDVNMESEDIHWNTFGNILMTKRAHSGGDGNSLFMAARKSTGGIYQIVNDLEPYTLYKLLFDYRLDSGRFKPYISVYGTRYYTRSFNKVLLPNKKWGTYENYFRFGDEMKSGDDTRLLFALHRGNIYIDNITITPVSLPEITEPEPGTILSSGISVFQFKDIGADSYDVALGTSLASADLGWFGALRDTTFTATDLPLDGSTVYARVFAHFGDYELSYDTTFIAGSPVFDPVDLLEPILISPSSESTVNLTDTDNVLHLTWKDVVADSYDVAIGTSIASPDIGWYGGLQKPELVVENFNTDVDKIFVRIFAHMSGVEKTYDTFLHIDAHTTSDHDEDVTDPIDETDAEETDDTNDTPPDNNTSCTQNFLTGGTLSAVWANNGEEKIIRRETRASDTGCTILNNVWDGDNVNLFGAKNEVVSFNLLLESGLENSTNLDVVFDELTCQGGAHIATGNTADIFNWNDRDIELFYIKYLQIEGLSKLSYGTYDERHIPEKFRRDFNQYGIGAGTWHDRPHHNTYYPEIAVPLELHDDFAISAGDSQSIWADMYIPKDIPAGSCSGNVIVTQNENEIVSIPVHLDVLDFTLADEPASDTMLFLSKENINQRYFGDRWLNLDSTANQHVRDNHFKLAHRHKIALIDAELTPTDTPSQEWTPRLTGDLFTPAQGYSGPGQGVGNGVYSIGTYSTWDWKDEGESGMKEHAGNYVNWFNTYSPSTDYFLYLIDESSDYPQMETWSSWLEGTGLKSFATLSAPEAVAHTPHLDISASWMSVGNKDTWQSSADTLQNNQKQLYMYNGKRPANGSFATEDDGVALRELAWAQYKMDIDRWFFWESTYYNNYQGGTGETNVFETAHTFGSNAGFDNVLGQTGWNYSNGDGVLFYPGTDEVYPEDSYDLDGPIASLRLKHWRRGIQDVDYITLAMQKNPTATQEIIDRMVPKALWEYGVSDVDDPTWIRSDISWSIDPDDWETARRELSDIILEN